MKLNGSQILMECLLEQSVDTVFGFPGGSVLYIYDALYAYSDKITHILTAHEQGACHAADGYARSSGKTGVVIATSGPGATNLVTGIATAYMDSIPLVAITGNVPLSLLGLDSFQEVDITGITMPITKHNYIVKDVKDLARIIREAFYIANEGRQGPVLIDIPKDISAAICDYKKQPEVKPLKVSPVLESGIEHAIKHIKASKKPYIYTGGGVISSGATDALLKFVSLIDAPVSSSLMGQGGFDNTDERYLGMLGMHGTVASAKAVSDCDLLIGIGTRFSDRVICDIKSFAPSAKIIHIDIDPAEIGKNISITHKVIGDIKVVLELINKGLEQQSHPEWMKTAIGWKSQFKLVQVGKDDEAITAQYVIETLDRLTNGDAIITTEVGQNQMWAAQYFNYKKPRTFVSSGGLGTMGFGLGAAIGAQTANPDKKVINIAGDGSFHMNANELVTVATYNIPIIELILNNSVLGMVRQWQRLFYDKRFSHTTLNRSVDYVMLANAYGIEAYRITKKSEVEGVLKKALSVNKPILLDIVIDKDLNVLPIIPAGAPIHSIITDITIN